jgi:hypothetical protein
MGDIDKLQRICELATILEIVTDNTSINVPIDPRIDIKTLTADDKNPMFVNVEVVRNGMSGNRRRYPNNVVHEIAMMIPGTQGYFGHPDPNKTGFEFRDPQCVYVGSMIEEQQDGVIRAIGKAYVYKSSNLREWLPKSIAAGKPLTVSINGVGDVVRDLTNNVTEVRTMSKLDSIDWANPGTEGMGTSQALSVVSEMNNGGGDNMAERNEIVKSVTVTELQAYNPEAIVTIAKGMTIAELQQRNPDLVKQIQDSAKITEMSLKVDGADKAVKLGDVQGLLDARDSKITELQNSINQSKLDTFRTSKLAEVEDVKIREQIGKRVVGKTEKEIEDSIAFELSYIKEISSGNNNIPKKNARSADVDMENSVKALFGVKASK